MHADAVPKIKEEEPRASTPLLKKAAPISKGKKAWSKLASFIPKIVAMPLDQSPEKETEKKAVVPLLDPLS